MKAMYADRVYVLARAKMLAASFIVVAASVHGTYAYGTTLMWNGADGDTWNAAASNWLDGETPSAWVDMAGATFGSAASVALNRS